jgi:hypothetical protein
LAIAATAVSGTTMRDRLQDRESMTRFAFVGIIEENVGQ